MTSPIRDLLTEVRHHARMCSDRGDRLSARKLSELVGMAEAYEARRENDRRNLREELRELAARLGPQEDVR